MIIFSSILYLIVFMLATAGIFFAVFVLTFAILEKLGFGTDNDDEDEDEEDSSNSDVDEDLDFYGYGGIPPFKFKLNFPKYLFPLFLVSAVVSIPLAYYSLSLISYYPPFLTSRSSLGEESLLQTKQNVGDLSEEAEKIHKALSNIRNLTLNDIEVVLSNTLSYLEKLKEEAINKEQTIEKLKADLNKLNSLSSTQLEVVAEAVSRGSNTTFWAGVLISFPTGVFASLVANWIWGVYRRKRIYNKKRA